MVLGSPNTEPMRGRHIVFSRVGSGAIGSITQNYPSVAVGVPPVAASYYGSKTQPVGPGELDSSTIRSAAIDFLVNLRDLEVDYRIRGGLSGFRGSLRFTPLSTTISSSQVSLRARCGSPRGSGADGGCQYRRQRLGTKEGFGILSPCLLPKSASCRGMFTGTVDLPMDRGSDVEPFSLIEVAVHQVVLQGPTGYPQLFATLDG